MQDRRIRIDQFLAEPKTRLGIFDTEDMTSNADRRMLEMMRTGGVMLCPLRITDAEIENMREVFGPDADIRRDARMGGIGVEFYSHAQAIKFGLLPAEEPAAQ